jgi:hypothetical protein
MTDYIVVIVTIFVTLIIMGFIIDIHASQCSMPDIQLPNDTHCPTICECARDSVQCQIPACNHLDCINWYWMCIYKWR